MAAGMRVESPSAWNSVVLLIIATALTGCSQTVEVDGNQYIKASFEQLISNPARYDGKLVRFISRPLFTRDFSGFVSPARELNGAICWASSHPSSDEIDRKSNPAKVTVYGRFGYDPAWRRGREVTLEDGSTAIMVTSGCDESTAVEDAIIRIP